MKKEYNLPELLEEISEQETGHPETQKRAIMAFMDLIVKHAKDKRVELPIGTFEYRKAKARKTKDLKGVEHDVPEKMILKFRCAKKLKLVV